MGYNETHVMLTMVYMCAPCMSLVYHNVPFRVVPHVVIINIQQQNKGEQVYC